MSSGLDPRSVASHGLGEGAERIVKRPRLVDEFEQIYERWSRREITQAQAAGLLGRSARTFRRYVRRYEASGLKGLEDRRAGRTGGPGVSQ